MATVAPSADQATDLLQKMSLESPPKALEIPEPTKKPSANQFGSVDSTAAANGERSVTPMLQECMDPSLCYFPNAAYPQAYYYGSYDGSVNDWDGNYSRYINSEGVDVTSGMYGDNGSAMYHGYGYAPYAPYSPAGSPVPTMGNDAQLYGSQQYQYPQPYFQPLTPTSRPYTPTQAPPTQGDVSTHKPLPAETANGKPNGVANGNVKGSGNSAPLKPTYQNSTAYNSNGTYSRNALQVGIPSSPYQDPKYYYDGSRSPIPWLDSPMFSDGQSRLVASSPVTSNSNPNGLSSRNANYSPSSYYMGIQHQRSMSGTGAPHGYVNRTYPNKVYGQYGNPIGSGMGYGSSAYGSRAGGRSWYPVDNKYKPRGRGNGYFGYGTENTDGLNELNRGPRARGSKDLKDSVPATFAVKDQNVQSVDENIDKSVFIPDCSQYNQADFAEEYVDAKFFIIKSYSEDDVHKSIKYNVWASTPNGNKKLDAAFREAQEKSGGCPVFLLFSVNTSGQFVGLAEMVGPVDFNKNCEYWQQDKWNGCFNVKWHIVKDVPNSLLKHITLENNENKPVTNSRDTQEVKLEQGLKIIKIFKDHSSKTSILDDFVFYETRQKTIQDKKAKQQQFQKQVWEGKTVDEKKEVINSESK